MPYISREDGVHFVIPSYRDVLSAKNKNALKRDILLLSQSYGEYITLQRKSPIQYEVAFSPDTGYLLGETVWHYFKRPLDMVYCEAIPNTTEALLVIVKGGSVYLDGSFPLESIPEELIIFLTQQNNFEIYTYGDVPISQTPETGKFSFEPTSVKSFTILDKPVFPELPLLKIYQLQLVDQVLRVHGIGVFPLRQLLIVFALGGLLWLAYEYITSRPKIIQPIVVQEDPYQGFYQALATPAPDQILNQILSNIRLLYSMPGWTVASVDYSNKKLSASVKSSGGKMEELFQWAKLNNVDIIVATDGIKVVSILNVPIRLPPKQIYLLKDSLGKFIDGLGKVYPGNNINMGELVDNGVYQQATFTVNLLSSSPMLLQLIAEQTKDLPFVLQRLQATVENGNLTGTITFQALGN